MTIILDKVHRLEVLEDWTKKNETYYGMEWEKNGVVVSVDLKQNDVTCDDWVIEVDMGEAGDVIEAEKSNLLQKVIAVFKELDS